MLFAPGVKNSLDAYLANNVSQENKYALRCIMIRAHTVFSGVKFNLECY